MSPDSSGITDGRDEVLLRSPTLSLEDAVSRAELIVEATVLSLGRNTERTHEGVPYRRVRCRVATILKGVSKAFVTADLQVANSVPWPKTEGKFIIFTVKTPDGVQESNRSLIVKMLKAKPESVAMVKAVIGEEWGGLEKNWWKHVEVFGNLHEKLLLNYRGEEGLKAAKVSRITYRRVHRGAMRLFDVANQLWYAYMLRTGMAIEAKAGVTKKQIDETDAAAEKMWNAARERETLAFSNTSGVRSQYLTLGHGLIRQRHGKAHPHRG